MEKPDKAPKSEADKASVLSNVANILGVSGAREGQNVTPDVEALKNLGVEPDYHPIMYFWGFLAAVTVFVVASVFGVSEFVKTRTQSEVQSKVLSAIDPRLPEVRAYEAKTTKEYDVIDAAKGQYRIPVAEAMKIIAANPKLVERVTSGQSAPVASEAPKSP